MRSVKLCFIVYSTRKAHSPNFICRIFSRSSEPFSPSLNMSHIVTSRYNSHSSNSNPLYIYALFFSPTFGGMLRCVLLQSTEYVKTVLQSMHGIHYFVLNVGGQHGNFPCLLSSQISFVMYHSKIGFINKLAHYVLLYIESYFMILIVHYIYINSNIPIRNIQSYDTSIITR